MNNLVINQNNQNNQILPINNQNQKFISNNNDLNQNIPNNNINMMMNVNQQNNFQPNINLLNNNVMMNNSQNNNNMMNNLNIINQNSKSNNNLNMNKVYLKEIKKFKKPPLIGLQNIGATCYMNATLQCLSNVGLLTGYFLLNKSLFENIPRENQEKKLSKAFSEVLYHLWNPKEPNKYYSPNYFKEVISTQNELFAGIQANDSKDLLIFLYQTMHSELNMYKNIDIIDSEFSNQMDANYELNKFRKNYFANNKSIINDLFYFDQANSTKCLNCKTVIYNFAIYNILIFPLEKTRIFKSQKNSNFASVNIKDCFDCFTCTEQSQPGNNFYCNNCKQESAYELRNQLSSFPEILSIVLNRGSHLEFDVNFTISYLLDDLDEYLIKLNSNQNEIGVKYELIGIIIHIGNSGMDGHFYTYCKSPVDKEWYWFNDAIVEKINDPHEKIKGIPYLLFYQKIKN